MVISKAQQARDRRDEKAAIISEQEGTRREEYNQGTSPLRWEDLTPEERRVTAQKVSDQQVDIKAGLVKVAASNKGSKKRLFLNTAHDPDLKQAPMSLTQVRDRLVSAMSRSAEPDARLPHESLAGLGFYFEQHNKYAQVAEETGRSVYEYTSAGAQMSNQTTPLQEARTAIALGHAHAQGSIHFHPDVVARMAQGYVPHGKPDAVPVHVPLELQGQRVAFRDIPADLLPKIRKRDFDSVVQAHSRGVDWEGMRSVSMDKNLTAGHKVLQGGADALPSVYKNPKKVGYSESSDSATPEYRPEYELRAKHMSDVLQGHQAVGQSTLDVTGHQAVNEGILGNQSAIAADQWTRAAVSGQKPRLAAQTAHVFSRKKGGVDPKTGEIATVALGDDRVANPIPMEHAFMQEGVERASRKVERTLGTSFTVPSRMVQETAGWAEVRRQASADPEFNAHRKAQDAAAKGAAKTAAVAKSKQFQQISGQTKLF